LLIKKFFIFHRQAVEEILKEARRSKELANDLGAFGWYKVSLSESFVFCLNLFK
jgi:hypothetical protein